MDSWIRFSAQSQSKEKVIRAAQYSCMVLAYSLQRSRTAPDLQRTISELEKHLSLSRKLLRLGQSLEALEAAQRCIHLSDGVLRLCLTVAHLNRVLYFACDNVLWAGKTTILSQLDQHKWTQRSYRFYLVSVILSLTRDVYELCLLLDRETRSRISRPSDAPLPGSCGGVAAATPAPGANRPPPEPPLLLDLLKNSCDVFIPLDRLGLCRTGPGFVGTCGLVSSVLSILAVVHPWLKLKP